MWPTEKKRSKIIDATGRKMAVGWTQNKSEENIWPFPFFVGRLLENLTRHFVQPLIDCFNRNGRKRCFWGGPWPLTGEKRLRL